VPNSPAYKPRLVWERLGGGQSKFDNLLSLLWISEYKNHEGAIGDSGAVYPLLRLRPCSAAAAAFNAVTCAYPSSPHLARSLAFSTAAFCSVDYALLSAGALSARFLGVVEPLCASCVPRRHYSCFWTRAGCGTAKSNKMLEKAVEHEQGR
jgi:hypothetical protein